SIIGLFSQAWKRHLAFFIPLALCMGIAIGLFSHVMKWLLNHHDKVTFYFFIGLIFGILRYLFREVRVEKELAGNHFVFMLAGIIGMFLLPEGLKENAIIIDFQFSTYVLLFISGILASAAMILPGISGSFVFLVIGVYETIIHAVSAMNIKILFIAACGIVI